MWVCFVLRLPSPSKACAEDLDALELYAGCCRMSQSLRTWDAFIYIYMHIYIYVHG